MSCGGCKRDKQNDMRGITPSFDMIRYIKRLAMCEKCENLYLYKCKINNEKCSDICKEKDFHCPIKKW